MFLLVAAYPGCPGQTAVKWLLLLPLMASFRDNNVSQGSVATYARCSGIFNIHLTTNLLKNLPVNKFF